MPKSTDLDQLADALLHLAAQLERAAETGRCVSVLPEHVDPATAYLREAAAHLLRLRLIDES